MLWVYEKMIRKTDILISEATLKKTTKCKKGFSCLKGDRENMCRVELNIGDKIHFVKCMGDVPCDYRVAFGYSFVCLCPVRKELFNRYNI